MDRSSSEDRDSQAGTSLTEWGGSRILWYPDRKFFLLGKRIRDEWLSDLEVPEQ